MGISKKADSEIPENIEINYRFNKDDLKKNSVRGGNYTFLAQGSIFLLQLISTYLLARILSPADFGLIAMVMAIIKFVNVFNDGGLSVATIQTDKINQYQISNLFWINSLIGLLLMMVVIGISPLLAIFYQEDRVIAVASALSFCFFLGGLAIQHQALLSRQMKFRRIAFIKITSNLLSVVIALVLAYLGFGYWSIIWMYISVSIVNTTLFWIGMPWLPEWPQKKAGIRSMLLFGKDISLYNIIEQLSQNIDKMLVGKYFGTTSLGFYEKAFQMLMLPIYQIREPIFRVATPALSAIKNEPERYKKYFDKLIYIIAFLTMPIAIYAGIFADEIVLLILGPKWQACGDIFKVLAIAAFIQPVSGMRGLALITFGRTNRYLIWGIINASSKILLVILAIKWGVIGITIAYAIQNYLVLWPSLNYCLADTPISPFQFLKTILLPALNSVMAGLIVYGLKFIFVINSNIISLIVYAVLMFSIYLIICSIAVHNRELKPYQLCKTFFHN